MHKENKFEVLNRNWNSFINNSEANTNFTAVSKMSLLSVENSE